MSLLNTLEARFGRFAIPGLLRIVAGFQALVFALTYSNNKFLDLLLLKPDAVLDGQVWRLLSWTIIPQTDAIIWAIIMLSIMWFIGDTLERAWGAFRLNLYFFSTVLCVIIVSFTPLWVPGFEHYSPALSGHLFSSHFLAFAILFPEVEFLLFFLIPVKAKWLGLVDAAVVIFGVMAAPVIWPLAVACHIAFLVFALPKAIINLRTHQKVAVRRAKFEAGKLPDDDTFHRCHSCDITDKDDPTLDFRVAEDEEEYCTTCLEKRDGSGGESP